MKTALIAAIAIAIISILYLSSCKETTAKPGEGIKFEEGKWADVLAKAKQENKLIFLDAYASWCGPCKRLKSDVFTNKEVGDYYNKNFICVAADMEEGEGVMLAGQYDITSYPTLLFLNSDGKIVHQAMGYHGVNAFLELGASINMPK